MGLITKQIEVVLSNSTIKYYENLGYEIPRKKDRLGRLVTPRNTKILVMVKDLQNGSHVIINATCDCCGKPIENLTWQNYKKYIKEDEKYYCYSCAIKQETRNEKRVKTILNNGEKSFKKWCQNNSKQDILNRWDYELNNKNPNEVTYATNNRYYFKCPKGLHESELKIISAFTSGQEGSMYCNQCLSFAQWGIDNICSNFLEKYWDYNKNKLDPWKISYGSKKNIWIKCQEIDYHDSYLTTSNRFTMMNQRCPYCRNFKIHPMDSLGKLLKDKDLLHLWSDKNKKSPYEYAPHCNSKLWWKCLDGKHKDYIRNANDANKYNFRCPECQYSQGEEKISLMLINFNFNKITDAEYYKLTDDEKFYNKYYIPQKEFVGLIGLGDGLLSYDFYLPQYNLLIEYQGIQHEKYIPGFYKFRKDFERQQEHDRRKREYVKNHNIKLLEIWYWDFDNIEQILEKELLNLKYKN
jgi:hypothetical protein